MPFRRDPFLQRFEPLRRWQQRPLIGYSVAIVAVGAATLLRLALGPVMNGMPFTIFYPAVAVAAAVGGTRPGIIAIFLSVIAASFLLRVPDIGFSADPISLFVSVLFVAVSALIVFQIMLLNEAIERLARQADNSRAILDSQPTGIVAVDEQGLITLVNSTVERQLGYGREELLDKSVELLVPEDLRSGHVELRTAFMNQPRPRWLGVGRDIHAQAKDGSLLPVEVGLNPVSQGGRSGTLAVIVDISERKSLEWRTQVLANEVQHRSRNLLTIVQALALRMLPKQESTRFMEVLAALARTHELFGTATTGSLRRIFEGELAPFLDQCEISICDMLVGARAGQDITLIVHELVTNGVKYGALSTPNGRVTVTGTADDGMFRLEWRESGGPPVVPPRREGVGKTILRDLAEGLGAQLSLDYAQQGFRYELVTPLDRLSHVAPFKAAGS